MTTNNDIALICKRIGEKVNASSRILTKVAQKLHELGGVFDGNRTEWAEQFDSYHLNTVNRMTNILVGKGVIVVTKDGPDGREVSSYALDYSMIESMLSTTGPDPTRHKTNNVRGKCGHMAIELYDGICYGCHVANMINRQRKGKCKV